jgi:hypothetical protein
MMACSIPVGTPHCLVEDQCLPIEAQLDALQSATVTDLVQMFERLDPPHQQAFLKIITSVSPTSVPTHTKAPSKQKKGG